MIQRSICTDFRQSNLLGRVGQLDNIHAAKEA
jgi:hypothetical protein